MKKLFVIISLFMCAQTAFAQKVGGSFSLRIGADPTNLHPIMATDTYSQNIHRYVFDSLMTTNEDTYELEPSLAEKMEISKDGLEFTFTLRDGAQFHDGTPVTVEDVKFSFDAIFISDFKAAHLIPYYENIAGAEILDTKRIKFKAKKKYFQNDRVLAELSIIPKKAYGNPKKKMNKTIMGSGPYKFATWDRGKRIVLKRNANWWGWNVPTFKGQYNFDQIIFRIVKEDSVAFEMLKKGDLDFLELTAEQYVLKAVGPEWGKKILKIKAENKSPKGYGYVAWNLRQDLFKDKNIRKGLAMLINRPLMNEKFRYNMSLLQTGPIYVTSDYADQSVKPVPFDPKQALEIFKAAGWEDKDKNGVLEKEFGGKKREFRFTLMTAAEDTMKYLTMIKEEAKKVGVDVELKLLEWNSFMKLIDEGKFDGMALGWGGGSVDPDPKQIWHSASATKGGSNFIGYSNSQVDKLIDEARETMDKKKRIEILKKVFRLVADDAPYAWLFSNKFVLYAHNSRVKKPKDTFTYAVGFNHWWIE